MMRAALAALASVLSAGGGRPRLMKKRMLITATVAAGTALTLAGAVHADSDSAHDQNEYLSTLQSEGFKGAMGEDSATLLRLGKYVCAARRTLDDGEIEQSVRSESPMTTHSAHIIRITANVELC
jgi:hypothetical protein